VTGSSSSRLRELARVFLTLGTTAFGGPAAHVAMMEDIVVRQRGWITRERFLDYVGATNLIPGPNSTELAIHIGHVRAGWPGLLVAGTCFILPAALIVAAIAWVYTRYGSLPETAALLYGVKPVVMAIIGVALWRLGRVAIKGARSAVLSVIAIAATASGVHELIVLAGGAALMMAAQSVRTRKGALVSVLTVGTAASMTSPALAVAGSASGAPFGLWLLFGVFVKAGAVLFGSGYVLLAFLRADFVERLRWLTETQLLDAIAIGQVTPGPLFTTATFVGYVLGGPAGAAVATVGIFVPAFIFVAISGPLVPRIRQSRLAGAALDGVNVASLALMAVVSWQLGRAALVDPLTIALSLGSLVLLTAFSVNSVWMIAAGAAIGFLVRTSP
jgi:chromate transporter